jgi:competence protein CoiA
MLSAYNQHQVLVVAWDVTKEQGPFFCSECSKPVILKKGALAIHHFAHYPLSACAHGTGEGKEHRQAKQQIYEALRHHPDVTKLAMERPLGEVRPDISFCWKGKDYVALEIQISPISPDEIARRTRTYTSKKIAVLWIVPYRREKMSILTPYRTSLAERYLHALSFGNVYYWSTGEHVLPMHFEALSTIVGVRWAYNEEEERSSVQGIRQFSPVLRNLDPGEMVRITDLKQVWRSAKQVGSFALPEARLWMLPHDETNPDQRDEG